MDALGDCEHGSSATVSGAAGHGGLEGFARFFGYNAGDASIEGPELPGDPVQGAGGRDPRGIPVPDIVGFLPLDAAESHPVGFATTDAPQGR